MPTRIKFRYQLEGFDHDWVDAGTRREAFYTNLRPGTYRFRVKAQNIDNTWSEIAGPVAITFAPHFYQRRWFFRFVWHCCSGPLVRISPAGEPDSPAARCGADRAKPHRRELHDTLMQGFSGITMEMQALSARFPETSRTR